MTETAPGTLAEALAALQGQLPRVAKTADVRVNPSSDEGAETCSMPCIVATLEETLACQHGWEWNPAIGWIHDFGALLNA